MGDNSGWGMNDSALYEAGTEVGAFEDDARSAGSRFRTAVDSAGGAVHHGKLTAAFGRFANEWNPPSRQLATAVDNAGTRLCNAAVTGRSTDNDVTRDGRHINSGTIDNSTRVRRDINVP